MSILALADFAQHQTDGCLVIDTRTSEIFCDGFIEESLSIPFGESFFASLQELTEDEQKLLFVADEKEIAAITKAINNAGVLNTIGFLEGGFETWANAGKKIDMLISIEADEFAIDYHYDEFFLIDIRTKEEFETEHVEDSVNIVLNDLPQMVVELETADSYYLYANTFAEAVTAASLFKQTGFERVRVVNSTYEDLKKAKLPFYKKKKEKSGSDFSNN